MDICMCMYVLTSKWSSLSQHVCSNVQIDVEHITNKLTNKCFVGGPLYFFSNASYYYFICRKWNSSLNAGPPAITYTYTRFEEYYAFVALMMTTMTMMMLVTEMALAHLLPTYSFTYRLLCHYKPCIFMAGDWYKELKK